MNSDLMQLFAQTFDIKPDRLKLIVALAAKGVGLGFAHYGVEVPAGEPGAAMQRWIGGHYEHQFSVNPMWSPSYEKFPAPEPEDIPMPAPRFQFPPDDGASTAGQREAVQARALLEKAERVGAKANAEDQAELARLTGKVKTALDERRWPDLTSASNALADVLFYLEDA